MEVLINVQKRLKLLIEKALTNLKNFPREQLSQEQIEVRINNLEQNWNLFKDNDVKLYSFVEQEQLYNTEYVCNSMYEKTEEAFIICKTQFMIILKQYASASALAESKNNSVVHANPVIKLPKICIPMFSGAYSEWSTFRNLFLSLIHNNNSLNDLQKLHYLKSYLTGEAEKLVRHTPITNENYTQCWEKLEKRYNNKKYLINCILKRLFNQKCMKIESGDLLKGILDTTNDCLSALLNLDVDVSTWDPIIIHIVSEKLDPETRKEWELYTFDLGSNELPKLKHFQHFIEKRFRALENLENENQASSSPSHVTKCMLTVNLTYRHCEFCSEKHKLCFCKKFVKLSLEDRQDFVNNNNICINCLGGNHIISECRKPSTCRICHQRHHSLLHHNVQGNYNYSIVPNSPSDHNNDKKYKPSNVLLPTALVTVKSKDNVHNQIRTLIDQSSQACFITEAAVQRLHLKKIPVHRNIFSLGNKMSTEVKYMVQITLKSRVDPTFKLNVNAYVVPKVTSPLPEQDIHLNCLRWNLEHHYLADPEFNISKDIDLLLGSNVYGFIIKNGIKRNPSNSLIAQNTSFGWIISGLMPFHPNHDVQIQE